MIRAIPWLLWCPFLSAQAPALFHYDRTVPFQYQEQTSHKDSRVEIAGAGLAIPGRGKLNILVVRPATGHGPFPAILYQHGGGQNMLTYLAEAQVMARAGAACLILDAPPASPLPSKPLEEDSAAEIRDENAGIVVCYRRTLDYLMSLQSIDPARIGLVGHSIGGIMAGILAGIDHRVKTWVLVGGVARYSKHMAVNQSDVWVAWRRRIGAANLAGALEELRPIDPDQYISRPGHGPVLFQCASFDSPDNVEGGQEYFRAASDPKELRWYDTDHSFVDIEATLDRMQWLEKQLKLKAVRPLLDELWTKPAKRTAPQK